MTWDPVRENIFKNQPWGKYPGEDLIRFVARNYYAASERSKIKFLEVGCGPGANLWYLAREGFSFVAVEGSSAAVEQARARLDAEVPNWRELGEIRVGDIANLSFEADEFDAAIDIECIYCNPWELSQKIYSSLARVVKPGGRLFSRTFARGSWGDGTGDPVGHNAWRCSEGPLAGKGFSRFSARDEISDLIGQQWCLESVELLSRTHDNESFVVKEWLITAARASA